MHTIFDRFASARTCLFAAFSLAVSFAFAAPGKPENVAATTDRTDGIRLTWNAVEGASYYVVYRYGGKTAQTGLVQQKVTARNWLDTSCEAGANITYRVRAFDSSDAGGAYSAYVRGYRKVLLEPYVGGNVSVNPLANGGAAQSLKVRCNVDWTAKASDWIHLNSGSYERSNEATELGFSLEPNTTGAAREGTITVYAGQESKTLKVIQGAVEVPEYDTWCGDSALAIIEDAAFPEEFLFRTEYTGGFLSYADETATGGSCLRSSPMDIGGSAVISWTMPSAWKLRFRWRKDSSKSRQVRFASRLDCETESAGHAWHVAGRCEGCVRHDGGATHFHRTTRLAGRADSGVHDYREFYFVDENLDEIRCGESLVRPDGRAERHDRSSACLH